jgi:hypothetical protein
VAIPDSQGGAAAGGNRSAASVRMNSAETDICATSVPDWENKNHFRTGMRQTLERLEEILVWATLSDERMNSCRENFAGK